MGKCFVGVRIKQSKCLCLLNHETARGWQKRKYKQKTIKVGIASEKKGIIEKLKFLRNSLTYL